MYYVDYAARFVLPVRSIGPASERIAVVQPGDGGGMLRLSVAPLALAITVKGSPLEPLVSSVSELCDAWRLSSVATCARICKRKGKS